MPAEVHDESQDTTVGAGSAGRRTYDTSNTDWAADGSGSIRTAVTSTGRLASIGCCGHGHESGPFPRVDPVGEDEALFSASKMLDLVAEVDPLVSRHCELEAESTNICSSYESLSAPRSPLP